MFVLFLIPDNESTNIIWKGLYSILIYSNIFCVAFISVVIYGIIYIYGYYYLWKSGSVYLRETIFIGAIIFISGLLFFSVYFEGIRGVIVEIVMAVWLCPILIIGGSGLMLQIQNKPGKLIIIIFVLNALWSIFNTFTEQSSSICAMYLFNKNDPANYMLRKDDIRKFKIFTDKFGEIGGYFVAENNFPTLILSSRLLKITELADNNSYIHRINITKIDTTNAQSMLYFRRSIHRSVMQSLNEINTWRFYSSVIDSLGVNWIYVNSSNFIAPPSLEKNFPVEHKFTNFSIYTKY